jgi:hypothetical protein
MWERLGRRNAKRRGASAPLSGALGRVGSLVRGQEPKKPVQTPYGGPLGLGLGALAIVATVSLVVLVLRRRAARHASPVEESNEEAIEANEES